MSVTKEIYNYLGIQVIESPSSTEHSSTDSIISIGSDYDESSGYQSDLSCTSDLDVERNVLNTRNDKRRSVEPLDVIDKLETMAMLNYVSDVLDLVCRLGPYIRPNSGNRTSFNNKVNELIDALYDAPSQRIFKKNRACSDILISLQMLKDELIKT